MSVSDMNMLVTKRNGELEELSFDKILNRIRTLGQEANININYQQLVMKVINQLYDKIPTTKIDELASEQCASLASTHPDYSVLSSRIVVSNHQRNTNPLFSVVTQMLYGFKNKNGVNQPLINDKYYEFILANLEEIDNMIVHDRDYLFDYFGFKTLEKAYLFKINGLIVERPQHMWMRCAIQIHGDINDKNALKLVKETYDLMSTKHFTHATSTLFNSGTNRTQLSSCYLVGMESDSIDGIFNTLKDCAIISKHSGGIGLHVHNIRAEGSHIHGTNGTSDGLVPMLRVFNNTARYANQSGKRKGSFAIYLEPWHSDIFNFLLLKSNHGAENERARDLFYGLWVSDLFMKRVKSSGKWSLMCPNECPGLSDVWGEEFEKLYERYEAEGRAKQIVDARKLWFAILDSHMETGSPYLMYKDAVNSKSNQQNLGTIKSSNLCTEITEYSDADETAVCNLASIGLPTFVNKEAKTFDFEKLHEVVKTMTNNLNKVIDVNFYPTEKARRSNMRHRPIGVGVQGLANVFLMLDMAFDSPEASRLNKEIFETIYHGALEKSNEIAIERGKKIRMLKCEPREKLMDFIDEYEYDGIMSLPDDLVGSYSSFMGSPASKGVLQFDMWNVSPATDRYDWDKLKESIKAYGLRNSLLVAPMPTASTSQLLGFNECFEPITSNLYTRRVLAGDYVEVNDYLIHDLIKLGLWSQEVKDSIIVNNGSIQHLKQVPEHIRNKYKTVWELSMKTLIDMSADRGAYICQSQSLNLWVENPDYKNLTRIHFYAWEKGVKTGVYYLRRRGKHQAQQFTIDPSVSKKALENEEDVCTNCSA